MTEEIYFAGGCFWCVESIFQKIPGVTSVTNGYMGGQDTAPTYEKVCSGLSGHAEVVKVVFDSQAVTLTKLLRYFWHSHDPTSYHRQGADVGSQYRSAIFYQTEAQKTVITQSVAALQKELSEPIVTEVQPAQTFYPAEEYHQNYFQKNPTNGYCLYWIPPKLKKLGL